jgi:hypothetical protein
MAYDSARGVTVLFGGSTGTVAKRETWEWDGSAWTRRSTAGPPPLFLTAMAYDSARGVTVLFGGRPGTGGRNGETWEWDGSTWTLRATTGPAPRETHAMAYDSARGVTVLFGGNTTSTSAVNNDTWEWNGTLWSLRTTTGPTPRREHALAFDADRGVCVLFGGYNSTVLLRDTWEWNGSLWTLRSTGGPTARVYHAMVYDAARGACVLFGGYADPLNGETWEWACGGLPVSIRSHPSSLTLNPGDPATFSVTTVGPVTFYQWRHNGVPLTDGRGISGSNTPTLSILLVGPSHAGVYDCVVTGDCNTVTSNPATLTLICIADVDDGSSTGTPDGGVTIDDLLYYLRLFEDGDLASDVDDGSFTGTLDGGVTIDDLLYFLFRFEAGC